MGINASNFLHDVGRSLRPRAEELVDELAQRIRGEMPELWEHPDLDALANESLARHVANLLDVLERNIDISEIRAPTSAVEFARRLPAHGIEISTLLRSYRLGHLATLQLFYAEITSRIRNPELARSAFITLVTDTFAYIDRTSEQAVAAYQKERDIRLQRRLFVISEASGRIGTTLDIARTAEELAHVGIDHLADFVSVDLLDSVLHDDAAHSDPLLLRRIAQRSVLDGHPESSVDTGRPHRFPGESAAAQTVTTGKPLRYRLSSAGLPEWLAGSTLHAHAVRTFGIHSMLLIPLSARRQPLGFAQFLRHRTAAPFDDDDLLLAQEIASRAAVNIDNARQYTHERSTALTLQRSLLPRHVPQHPAVETAARYMPTGSRAGVGGDWYDVIPLSGARVALVIGDVVGRGLHASATMGRLRTAVHTLADIDLMPDELLTHLDDVVIRLQHEQETETVEISATCLYAVYDPVSRACAMASAGHYPPAVVTPPTTDSPQRGTPTVDYLKLPTGPPLGLGGLPFETAQFELPEGSLLALYTDGLVEDRTRGLDSGLALLHVALSGAKASLEDTCDHLISALAPSHPTDDITLLVARTHALNADHVATLDIPSDPAVVSRARSYAADQLAAWKLEEMSFTTELMVSELVTNAIRYGRPPIQLRMILQSTLTCEVSDASNTAPHLRRARTFDEGGRGLLLVAQLAEHWGTRHTREGKVIWAEQLLPVRLGAGMRRS